MAAICYLHPQDNQHPVLKQTEKKGIKNQNPGLRMNGQRYWEEAQKVIYHDCWIVGVDFFDSQIEGGREQKREREGFRVRGGEGKRKGKGDSCKRGGKLGEEEGEREVVLICKKSKPKQKGSKPKQMRKDALATRNSSPSFLYKFAFIFLFASVLSHIFLFHSPLHIIFILIIISHIYHPII